jgi:hypothetical protein
MARTPRAASPSRRSRRRPPSTYHLSTCPGGETGDTRWSQEPLSFGTCGFESHPGYSRRSVCSTRNATNVRSQDQVDRVAELVASGLNDCAIARITGIPRTTVRDWRLGKRTGRRGRSVVVGGCVQCGGPPHEYPAFGGPYSYLLALYLGDGCLSKHRGRVLRLRVVLDSRYPGIIRECRVAMRQLTGNAVCVQHKHKANAFEVSTYSKQLPCVFPQHGPGRKHDRQIYLAAWQRDIVENYPEAFIRGLIHSDGCRSLNTIRHPKKTYAYPRYQFSNRSDDIRGLFCWACDLLGIDWRVMNRWKISVARRESVARLDEFVGPKA